MKREKPVVGWREWVLLPGWLELPIKAKIDSGARTSSIHAFEVRRFSDRGAPHVEFLLHPIQRQNEPEIACVAPIKDERPVRSSNGEEEMRIFVEAAARLGSVDWTIELSLTDRDMMGFRMLLGREAIRRRFVIDPGRSYRLSESHPEAVRALELAA